MPIKSSFCNGSKEEEEVEAAVEATATMLLTIINITTEN